MEASFLAENGVAGEPVADEPAQHSLRLDVGAGDGRAVGFALHGQIRPLIPLQGEIPGPPGGLDGEVDEIGVGCWRGHGPPP